MTTFWLYTDRKAAMCTSSPKMAKALELAGCVQITAEEFAEHRQVWLTYRRGVAEAGFTQFNQEYQRALQQARERNSE
jgi:hypothetical protein